MSILVKSDSNIKLENRREIIEGRLISVDIKINNTKITLLNIYGPNKDDERFFQQLEQFLIENNHRHFIIGGDFNTVMDMKLDEKNGTNDAHKRSRKKLYEIIQSCNLNDVWRVYHPNTLKYTWHSNTKPHIHCRLDYFLISNTLMNIIKSTSIKYGYKTDHSSIVISLNSIKMEKGRGYFKMNNSLLLDKSFQEKIKESIKTIKEYNNESNPQVLWELVKGEIRNGSIYRIPLLNIVLQEFLKNMIYDINRKSSCYKILYSVSKHN